MQNAKKQFKRILLITIVFCMLFPFFIHEKVEAATYTERQKQVGEAFALLAEDIIKGGNKRDLLRYSQNLRDYGYKWKKVGSGEFAGKITFDCSSFTSFVAKYATDGKIAALYSTASYPNSKYFVQLPISEKKRGDFVWYRNGEHGHIAVYLGNNQIAHASTAKSTPNCKISSFYSSFTHVFRLKEEYANQVTVLRTSIWGEDNMALGNVDVGGFYYNGLAKISTPVEKPTTNTIFDFLTNIANFIIDAIVFAVKIQIIGWTSIFENVVSSVVYTASGQEQIDNQKLTIEKIIYNKVPVLDVNLFDLTDTRTTANPEGDVIYIIRDNLAKVYYSFRNIAIIGLLIVLIYIGIRMALATIAQDKAKYISMFKNWLVSFIIVFFIHFFMLGVILINDALVDRIAYFAMGSEETVTELRLVPAVDENNNPKINLKTGETYKVLKPFTVKITKETSLYDSILTKAYDMKASEGFAGTMLYVFLVYYLVKFLIIYFKRLLSIYILALISPLMAITYAIDKIKSNKSPSLARWMKDFSLNVFIQTIHSILYLIFVTTAMDLAFETSLVGIIIAFVFLNFMLKAEGMLLGMFNIGKGSSSFKTADQSTTAIAAATAGVGKTVQQVERTARKGIMAIGRGARTTVDDLADSSWGDNIAKHGLYKNTIGRFSDVMYEHDNDEDAIEEVQKTRNAVRQERAHALKQSTGAVVDLAMGLKELTHGSMQIISNPGRGFTRLMTGRDRLKGRFNNTEPSRVRENRGIIYGAANRTAKILTLGMGSLHGISDVNERNEEVADHYSRLKAKAKVAANKKSEELKEKVKKKALEEAMRRSGKITYSQVVQAKQAVLSELRMDELQLDGLDYMKDELEKLVLEEGLEISKEKFAEEVYNELDKMLADKAWAEKDEITQLLDAIAEDGKETLYKPTKDQMDAVLSAAGQDKILNMMFYSYRRINKNIEKKALEDRIEKYKKEHNLEGITVKDAELILKQMAREETPGGEGTQEGESSQRGEDSQIEKTIKAVSNKFNREKQSTYRELARKYEVRNSIVIKLTEAKDPNSNDEDSEEIRDKEKEEVKQEGIRKLTKKAEDLFRGKLESMKAAQQADEQESEQETREKAR